MIADEDFDALADADALDTIGMMVDLAGESGDAGLTTRALALADSLASRPELSAELQVLLHYFRANAFENQLHEAGDVQSWSWDLAHFEKVLLELRRAARHEGFPSLDTFRQCQILTNLGNKLNTIGRPAEALAQWDRAIALNARFAMALGNRGYGLMTYAQSLYDGGHSAVLMGSAHKSLSAASAPDAVYDSPEGLAYGQQFEAMVDQIAERLPVAVDCEDLNRDFSLGRSQAERSYRRWALDNRLFLSPLNDLGPYSIAAHDVLHLPSLTQGLDEGGPAPPVAFGFFNQLKQEFISARWLCYEGLSEHRAHFSDRDTHLYDTLSIPAYSLAVEKTKVAFRLGYSLFDKIAFFINDYFRVGLPERAVSFRSIWYDAQGDPKPLSAVFKDRENWPLRGLYWLSKDIYEPAFQQVSEPDAEGFADLRNYLEHKYCQIHEDLGIAYSRFAPPNGSDLSFRIGRDMLEAKALHILKLARAALTYLSLAVHREEAVRQAARPDGIVVSAPLWEWKERRRL
ncbi:MAG: LA2681 family HEPN domain-containing protein [Sphingomicrobium sp.]